MMFPGRPTGDNIFHGDGWASLPDRGGRDGVPWRYSRRPQL